MSSNRVTEARTADHIRISGAIAGAYELAHSRKGQSRRRHLRVDACEVDDSVGFEPTSRLGKRRRSQVRPRTRRLFHCPLLSRPCAKAAVSPPSTGTSTPGNIARLVAQQPRRFPSDVRRSPKSSSLNVDWAASKLDVPERSKRGRYIALKSAQIPPKLGKTASNG